MYATNFTSRYFSERGEAIPKNPCNEVVDYLSTGLYFTEHASQNCFGWVEEGEETIPEKLKKLVDVRKLSMKAIWDDENNDPEVVEFRDIIEVTCKAILTLLIDTEKGENDFLRKFYNVYIVQKYGSRCFDSTVEGYKYPWWELACAVGFSMGRNLMQVRDEKQVPYFHFNQFGTFLWGLPKTGKSIIQTICTTTYPQDMIHESDNQKSAVFTNLDKSHRISVIRDNQKEGSADKGVMKSFLLPLICGEPARGEKKHENADYVKFQGAFFAVGNATLPKDPEGALLRRPHREF